jgi:hemolysin activation/secretion protein
MYRLGEYLAKDRLRAIMLGLDLDMSDKLGRTIISNDMEIGIPGIMGGLENKDPRAFFLGAGGKYIKNRLIAARRHKLFSGLEFLIKSQVQVSSHVLAGVDNFAVGGIGGVVDNRGYPRSSLLGDSGFSTTLGFAFPPYFVPKDLRVPFSKAKLYNALKLFVFYDWGNTTIKSPEEGLGREKTRTLRSVGCGFRFNLPEKFSLRADFGWPLDFLPSDNDHFHAWVKVSKEF